MRIYDISMAIHPEMTVWKDRAEKKPEFVITRDFENGQGGRKQNFHRFAHWYSY